ncbi:MAG: hypothetical protein ABEJ40_02485 [Haloarculaceae archaeon]
MVEAFNRASESSEGVRMYLLTLYYLAAGNLSISTMVLGALFIVLGATVVPSINTGMRARPGDVLAGMFGVWGASLIALGGIVYAALWANRIYARLSD